MAKKVTLQEQNEQSTIPLHPRTNELINMDTNTRRDFGTNFSTYMCELIHHLINS